MIREQYFAGDVAVTMSDINFFLFALEFQTTIKI